MATLSLNCRWNPLLLDQTILSNLSLIYLIITTVLPKLDFVGFKWESGNPNNFQSEITIISIIWSNNFSNKLWNSITNIIALNPWKIANPWIQESGIIEQSVCNPKNSQPICNICRYWVKEGTLRNNYVYQIRITSQYFMRLGQVKTHILWGNNSWSIFDPFLTNLYKEAWSP